MARLSDSTAGNQPPFPPPPPAADLKGRRFPVGAAVEVESYERGFVGSWYTARITSLEDNDRYFVAYTTLDSEDTTSLEHPQPYTELVDGYRVRPPQPPRSGGGAGGYAMLDVVDAWVSEGWWIGHICRVGAADYSVYFWPSNEVKHGLTELELRPRLEWTRGGNWISTPQMRNWLIERPYLGKVQSGAGSSASTTTFTASDIRVVEVRTGGADSPTPWFPALVLERTKAGKYVLECPSLVTGDGTEVCIIEADGSCMRPSPPSFEIADRFRVGEYVDAWMYGGWHEGRVARVLDEARYVVRLASGESFEFRFLQLRAHQVFTSSGRWISLASGRVLE